MTRLLLGSWNEKDNPDLPDWQVRSDARRIKRRFRGASIIGCQEIGERADHRSLASAFGLRWGRFPKNEATPILFNRFRFRLLEHSYIRCHSGIRAITPHRGYAKARFAIRRRWRLRPFRVYATHCISKPTTSMERARLWAKHIDILRADIAVAALAGEDIFVVGDFNKKKPPHLHPRQVVLKSHWVDHIIWIPGTAGNRVRAKDVFVMREPLFTDHKPIGVVLDLENK
jgi:hypothetical protein